MSPIRAMLNELGVTEQQWRVLRVLDEEGPLGPTILAERAALLLPSLTRILQGLESRGFIERHSVSNDKRRQRIAATPAGRALITENIGRAQQIAQTARDLLGSEKHDQLLDLLNELREKLSVPGPNE